MKKSFILMCCLFSFFNLSFCVYNTICINRLSQNKNIEPVENIKKDVTEVCEIEKSGVFIEDFINPLDDEFMKKVSSYQGIRSKITFNAGGETKPYHDALDIPCPDFTPVKAVKSGKVIECWPSYFNGGAKYKGHPTYGGYLEIQHSDGTRSIYAHLSLTSVKEGDIVNQGDIIGRTGGVVGRRGSGLTTGPHLHFSVKLDMNAFYSIKL